MRDDVADRFEIRELLERYVDAIDRCAWDDVAACFTADARLDYTSAGGPSGTPGDLVAWLKEVLPRFEMTQHLVTNVIAEVDGDSARARCQLVNPMKPRDGEMFLVGGSYADTLRRTPSGWRITERVMTLLWMKPL